MTGEQALSCFLSMGPLRVVVTGATGLLGRAILTELASPKNASLVGAVEGWSLTRTSDKCKRVDLSNESEIIAAVNEFKPDVIVHSAAIRSPDIVENEYDKCKRLNVDSTRLLAKLAVERNAYFLYISTDYVFDGSAPPYHEDSVTNPLNKYGQLKLDGELAVQTETTNFAILRVAILYGNVEYLGEGPVDVILKALLETNKENRMSHYEKRYPTHVVDVAAVIRLMLQHYSTNPALARGTFHWCGDEQLTKYEMAKVMAEVFRLSMDHMRPVIDNDPKAMAQRPYNAQLSCDKLKSLGAANKFTFKTGCIESYKGFIEK